MTFTVHPVPSMGAEDVRRRPGRHRLHRHRGRRRSGRSTRRSGSARRVADTGGRPLGLELLADGDLLVCDAVRGLLRVDPGSGAVEVLLDRVEGKPMRFCNNAAVAADGTIWFTDSSLHYGDRAVEGRLRPGHPHGRLVRRDPDGTVTVVLDGLAFANGVALAADESFVVRGRDAARAPSYACGSPVRGRGSATTS